MKVAKHKIKVIGYSISAYTSCDVSRRYIAKLITICSILILFASAKVPAQEIIVDNLDSNTSQVGTWEASGAPGFWATDSVWSIAAGNSFSFNAKLVPGATYAVYEWHTAWPGRNTSVPHQIRDGSKVLDTVNVNQTLKGGQWRLLGKYAFTSGSARVTIQVASGATGDLCSTNADAVRFVPVTLESIEITGPSTVNENSVTNYDVIAYFSDGSSQIVEPQVWSVNVAQASINSSGVLTASSVDADTPAVISAQYTAGSITVNDTHNITIHNKSTVVNIIVDNLDPTTSSVGTWGSSGAPGFWATDSVWSRTAGNSFSFNANLVPGATYAVYEWHTAWSSRYTAVPHQIRDGSTVLDTVNVNQAINGGQWRLLGTYVFTSGSARVTIQVASGATGDIWSTNADAVKFTYLSANMTPTAFIDSINPNPIMPNQTVSFTGHGTDIDGSITAYNWSSNIAGDLSNSASFSTSNLKAGTHTIQFKVLDNKSQWSDPVTAYLDIGLEHIYIAPLYFGPYLPKARFEKLLGDMGATQQSAKQWTYVDISINKTYIIHFIDSAAELTQAMYRDGAHIIMYGHSNYGLGGIFATQTEASQYMISNIRYMDDDRIINYSSPMISIPLSGMRTGQAFPNWWPNNKDGTSAIMPYDFDDLNGDPPYNYYLTYKIPGDTTLYRIQTVNNSYLQRFVDSGVPAWYSPDGRAPNPNITSERSYFIRNTAAWKPSFITTGTWQQFQDLPAVRDNSQYFKENYITNSAGTGNDTAKWIFDIPKSGHYIVSAWWPALSTNASNAPFTVKHSDGTTTVPMNQTINGHKWNKIGQFYFNANEYNVLLTDNVSSGNVVADGIRVAHINNPPVVVQADFIASPLSGYAPLNVEFDNTSTGDLTERTWNLGDGYTNVTRDELEHQYTTPGIYSVTLTVRGPDGTSTRTKTNYIHVWAAGSQRNEPLKAEFSSGSNYGQIPFSVDFTNRSTGNIISWLWNFGDGQTSSEQQPRHTYTNYGNYTVTLTVTNNSGAQATETKTNFVRAVIFEKSIDNVDYPKTHSGSKTYLKVKEFDVSRERFRYNRMLYDSCNSGDYYIETFGHGLFFYTVNVSGAEGSLRYLRSYLQGKSNHEIWEDIQQVEAVYDYFNFNLPPYRQGENEPLMMADATTAVSTSLSIDTTVANKVDALKQSAISEIDNISSISVSLAVEMLEDEKFLVNDELMEQAVKEALSDNSEEAVQMAIKQIELPVKLSIDGVTINRSSEFMVAKKIMQSFPEESIGLLLDVYKNGSVTAKENVVNVTGKLVNYPEVRTMLKKALDDQTTCINTNPELVGEPLRICDLAYNQLVLNLKIKDVLRVIGSGMDMETRDYHIDTLKEKL